MSKSSVLVLVVAAFLLGLWIGDGIRSPVSAQSASTAAQRPMFQEVVVPDKTGTQGAVYMIYNGSGQICPVSQVTVPLRSRGEKAAPSGTEAPAVPRKKTSAAAQ